MNVYRCMICKKMLGGQGFGPHMSRGHGWTGFDGPRYAPRDTKDYVMLEDAEYCWEGENLEFKEGDVVAKWLFRTSGTWGTIFEEGDYKAYQEWLPSRRAYIRDNYPWVRV